MMMKRRVALAFLVSWICFPAAARAQTVSAGAQDITGDGDPDGWTNVLYINEANPFSFAGTGQDHGVLTTFDFWVAPGRHLSGLVTPFVAEPVVEGGVTGEDFIIRAIGTTREAAVDYQCTGLFQFPFHDTTKFTVQNNWVAGFMSSDALGESTEALSPIPFVSAGVDGWLTGTSTAGSGAPRIELDQAIVEGNSGTDIDAYGLREYMFQIKAAPGDIQPPLGPGGKVGEACPEPPPPAGGNVAGTHPVTDQGTPDGWTNVLYINEERPFDFSEFGTDTGTLSEFIFNVAAGRESIGLVTPFVAEPLVENPQTGEDFIIRAIGTTREGGVDWEEAGNHTFPFSDTETPEVKSGWVAGFLSADPNSESDLAMSPIPFISNAGIDGWLTGTSSAASGMPVIELNETIVEGSSGTNVDAYGFRSYQFQIVATVEGGGDPGDFNADGVIDAADIDLLSQEVLAGTNTARFDLTGDAKVDQADRTYWVEQVKNSYFGDSNLDGVFSSGDLVHVFQRGKYEDLAEDNAGWDDGDWDGDRDFTSSDFVIAFQGLGYEQGPRAAVSAVPEPTSLLGSAVVLLLLCGRRRLSAGGC
jgi:hypothetical protein